MRALTVFPRDGYMTQEPPFYSCNFHVEKRSPRNVVMWRAPKEPRVVALRDNNTVHLGSRVEKDQTYSRYGWGKLAIHARMRWSMTTPCNSAYSLHAAM